MVMGRLIGWEFELDASGVSNIRGFVLEDTSWLDEFGLEGLLVVLVVWRFSMCSIFVLVDRSLELVGLLLFLPELFWFRGLKVFELAFNAWINAMSR